jgi:hypothetical protein
MRLPTHRHARLVKAGVDLPTFQKISGHKALAMARQHTHVYGIHIDDAISALDMDFSEALTSEAHTPAIPENPDAAAVVSMSAKESAA